ncbi:MAG TPA: ribonuclease H-like domain-containing protein [Anaeromyxobacteraceae bacterium]|nr:ribonuclease H-like domain-containing protein [Anaeromyxobacteraceae bacterium]
MIRSTFRLVSGVGPWAEGQIWKGGIRSWTDVPAAPGRILSPRIDPRLREEIARASELLAARDADGLAMLVPRAERWRLFAAFADEAAYLDIETDGGETITVIGLLDANGPRVLLAGRDLDDFPEHAARWKLLVTYNGLSFDVPLLKRRFPGWRPPLAHVDLRHVWHRLGHRGGLKLLERANGIVRPDRLEGLDGRDAIVLWDRHLRGDADATRLLVEYNLRDTVDLKPLAERGYNRLVERLGAAAPPLPESSFGDLGYDVTKLLLGLR